MQLWGEHSLGQSNRSPSGESAFVPGPTPQSYTRAVAVSADCQAYAGRGLD